jgi:hypothetical protein
MDSFPLRAYLRNHVESRSWRQAPPIVRSLFVGKDGGIRESAFFYADAKHNINQFIITQRTLDHRTVHQADVIVMLYPELAVLINYRCPETRRPDVFPVWIKAIESVGFRVGAARQQAGKNPLEAA